MTKKHSELNPTANNLIENIQQNFFSGTVVFLVALPLCLGISLASGAPTSAGLIAGIIGGIIVGFLSPSPLGVSGPAAGLVAIAYTGIEELTFPVFLLAVAFSGVIQIIMGLLRLGIIGSYVPSSVINGMLFGIGLIIILKQIPHAIGYDKDYEGDMDFLQEDGFTSFSELEHMLNFFSPGCLLIAVISFMILLLWDNKYFKQFKITRLIPAPLLAVVSGISLNQLFIFFYPELALTTNHLVSIPEADGGTDFFSFLFFPDFSKWQQIEIYSTGIIIALVASLETLLCLEATDKMDPHKRTSPANKELLAQGAGNIISGLIGGLPITQVIVRSSANIQANAKDKTSAIFHGFLLLFSVLFIPGLISKIPLACLAALMIVVGAKLARPQIFLKMYHSGLYIFIPFIATVIILILTNLLMGIAIGLLIAIGSIIMEHYRMAKKFKIVKHQEETIIYLSEHVSFLSKANLLKLLTTQEKNSVLIVDTSESKFIDHDIREALEDFRTEAKLKNITYNIIDQKT